MQRFITRAAVAAALVGFAAPAFPCEAMKSSTTASADKQADKEKKKEAKADEKKTEKQPSAPVATAQPKR